MLMFTNLILWLNLDLPFCNLGVSNLCLCYHGIPCLTIRILYLWTSLEGFNHSFHLPFMDIFRGHDSLSVHDHLWTIVHEIF